MPMAHGHPISLSASEASEAQQRPWRSERLENVNMVHIHMYIFDSEAQEMHIDIILANFVRPTP